VNLRRGVVGAEEQLISSLYLAAIQARALGDEGRAADFDREAKGLEDQITSPHFRLARRIENLFKNFDRKEAEAILEEVKGLKNHDLLAGAGVAAAMTDPDLTTTARLRQLEALLLELERRGASAGSKQPVQLAIATVLRDDRQYDRAVSWLRRILERHPLAQSARDLLVDTLWRASDWGGAAIFLKAQIDLHGARPGLMTAYGRSLLEAGDLSGAVTVLTKALKLIDHTSQQRDAIEQLRERALDLGGTLWPAEPAQSVSTPVVRDDVERALKDFATFLAADKRMGFWKKKGNSDYEWVPRPELRAQDLLHTFLKARFHERISVFEEFAAGAGRLDLLLRFEGGLSVIIELKMCGFGYSSAYASSGEEQIRHYMENRSVHLGYLVVHDARLDDFGTSVIQASETGIDTVVELFVDVRPRVSSRRSQA
jgi:tetratricopeptide (TPR) repeat protein